MITVIVPTVGRPSLAATLAAIGPDLDVIVVDDRDDQGAGKPLRTPEGIRVLRSGGRGPAAARNTGWRAARTTWIAFLDDDVVPASGWGDALRADLAGLPQDVGASQGRLEVPLPAGRRPTDAERNTAGLAGAEWITADIAYRRAALEKAGGFDERFPRAYREDADLALRVRQAGFRLVKGDRLTRHPVRDDGFWSSVRFQRGNADDALMRRLYGPDWRRAIGGAPGRLRRHALTTGLGLLAGGLTVTWALRRATGTLRRGPADLPRVVRGLGRARGTAAAATAAGWLALTAEFAWARIAPGPRTPEEVLRMAVTSAIIPPAACVHRARGELRVRRKLRVRRRARVRLEPRGRLEPRVRRKPRVPR